MDRVHDRPCEQPTSKLFGLILSIFQPSVALAVTRNCQGRSGCRLVCALKKHLSKKVETSMWIRTDHQHGAKGVEVRSRKGNPPRTGISSRTSGGHITLALVLNGFFHTDPLEAASLYLDGTSIVSNSLTHASWLTLPEGSYYGRLCR